MPFEFMRITGVPADMPTGGACIAKFDGLLVDYVAHVKERRGQSTARLKIDTASTIFDERRYDCGATSGGAQGMYLRLYITGAGGAGQALRAFTDVENVRGGTGAVAIVGAHISLKFGTTGSCAGLACALRATLHIPSGQTLPAGGDYCAIQAEIYADGAGSDPAGATHLSFFRVCLDGVTAGMDNCEDDVYLFDFSGGSAASNHMIGQAGDEPTWTSNKTYQIRCRLQDGTDIFLIAIKA